VLGVYDVYGGGPDAALRGAIQVPVNDPLLLIPGMAQVTEHLGFGVTSTLTYEPPLPFARRMSTLDHLTGGRICWNIVTGDLASGAKGAGKEKLIAHDTRHDIAEEYMDVIYKLWESSWDDDAVLRDRASGVYADPSKVQRITHDGEYFKLEAIHLAEPSPQRTPVLYQAGSSPKGRDFAARHAECVFVSGPTPQVLAPRIAEIRRLAAAHGRAPGDVQVFPLATPTEAEAKERHAEYLAYIDRPGALTLMSG
jgi:FMN-dependent oxidoreductase (nitrilotriacetate monooxygenase family)